MQFYLQMAGADTAVSMVQLLLLTAVTQAAVVLKDSTLTTDLLQMSCVCGLSNREISQQDDRSSSRCHAQGWMSRTKLQWLSATEGQPADGEHHTGNVTRRNKMADWTVLTKRRWHCRHLSFTKELYFVCVERRGVQLKRDAGKSDWESEIQHIVEPSKNVPCGGNREQQWTSTLTGCSHMFSIVAGGQNCQLDGLDHKPLCVSSTACYENHKDNNSCQSDLVHLFPI